MYCNKCGKQNPDDSRFCSACGAQIKMDGDISQNLSDSPSQENAAQEKPASSSKVHKHTKAAAIVILVLGAAVLLVYFAAHSRITADTVSITQLYNTELGIGLKLNTSKKDVDKLLGSPEVYGETYLYSESDLYATFSDGKLTSMYIEYPNNK